MFDYETLRIIWWAILVFLVCGFTVMDGFDLGIGMLLPFLGKTDDERRVMLNTIGPTWEGNQTWLITLGGISFGAWSLVYATFFPVCTPAYWYCYLAYFYGLSVLTTAVNCLTRSGIQPGIGHCS